MRSPSLTELMIELYRRLNEREPNPEFVEAVEQLRGDYDLEQDKVPEWLTTALSAALEGRETDRVLFERIGSEVSSFLSEVSELMPGWEHDDQGESIEVNFPSLNIQIWLSREALNQEGASCCCYTVRQINRP